MSKALARVPLIGVLIVLALSSPSAAQAPADTSADARLRALYTEEWNWRQKELARGDAASDRFPRVDAASQQARLAYWTRALATLDTIPFEQLSAEEKVNAQIFRTSLRELVSDVQYRTYEAPFNSDTFFWTSFTPRQGFATAEAYRSYLARLRDVPRHFDEQITNMRAGLARGYTVPRVSVIGRDQTIEPYVKGDASNPLYAPFAQMPAGIPAADQDALRAEANTVIRDIIAPAYAKLLTVIRQEYLEKARRTLAAKAMPDGEVFYQAQILKHTTLTLTPQEIHDIGLKEVARIEAEMRATRDKAKFKGTMAEFFTFMRSDPQFYAKTPRELLSFSAYVAKKADDKLAETIGFLPRRRHGIRPVPDAIAPIYTGGRGGLEACLMNTYNLPARPLYTIVPLTLHECTPGHSFQSALALEGPERPAFRRGTSFSGYGEGWGLYVEWLGTVMGIYETPYEDMGRLTYEMWRACRLVIDTGIHQFGWTREQAMSYLRDRAPLAEHEITTEIDRYIAWPGQALAYKLGELQIRRHRREAEEKLGARFDQRRFHDAILAIGSVPLPVLEERMAQFIADESAAAASLMAAEPDWSRFRGPNGSGLSTATGVPTEFGPDKNLLWRLALPQGHSSPILYQDRLYLTGFRGNDLVTLAIDRLAGKILWERTAPPVTTKVVDKRNNPASPSPAVEADGVYVFFPDYGLVAYDAAGKQLWQLPLGPFNNIYGMGASPVIAGNLLILACDQSLGSYVMALDKRTGKQVWKVERPEAKSGHSTPILWRGPDGRDQVLLPGSFLLTSYDAATGKKLWWVGGLSFEMKSTPVMGGDTIYVNGYGAPVNDPGNKISIPAADGVWKTADANGDGVIQKTEFPKFTPAFWFDVADLDVNGSLNKDEWAYYRAALDSENGMLAIRLGGSGDMSDTAIRWKYQRSVPQLPSPLLYRNVLYMVNDNGIVTTLNPDTGAVIKQGRLTGAPGAVFASPIAADGHVYFTTEAGAVVVVSPGGDLDVQSVNVLNEEAYATPAVADGRIYVRTTQALYAFGAR